MLLGAFLLGGLSGHEATAVRAHLDVCLECRTEHDYLACVPCWLDLVREQAADDTQLNCDHRQAKQALEDPRNGNR